MTDVPPTIGYAIDPNLAAPDDYDVRCTSCGASVISNLSDRCAACGDPIDLDRLPLARVPWLYRNRYGVFNAYLRTLVRIGLHPIRFAQELCRPVSISRAEAVAFRRVTIWIAVLSCVVGISGAIAADATSRSLRDNELVAWVIGVLVAIPALRLYFGLVTDLPTFIWRGRDARPNELAPLHLYACAPLALAPLLGIAVISAAFVGTHMPSRDALLTSQLTAACAVAAGIGFLWYMTALLFAVGAKLRNATQMLLAIYLPVHGVLSLLLTTLAYTAAFSVLCRMISTFSGVDLGM